MICQPTLPPARERADLLGRPTTSPLQDAEPPAHCTPLYLPPPSNVGASTAAHASPFLPKARIVFTHVCATVKVTPRPPHLLVAAPSLVHGRERGLARAPGRVARGGQHEHSHQQGGGGHDEEGRAPVLGG